MKIYKKSWSEDLRKNEFVHFYVPEPAYNGGRVIVYERPFAVSGETFKRVLNTSLRNQGKPNFEGEVLHVCFDMISGRVYLPDQEANAYFFRHPDLRNILAECYRALQEKHGVMDLKRMPIIKGDPLTTFRLRKLEDYSSAKKFIEKHLSSQHQDTDILQIPVVEANLEMMPTTAEELGISDNEQGLFVSKDAGEQITFVLKPNPYEGQRNPVIVHTQTTPFILINTAPNAKVSEADKERIVVTQLQFYVPEGKEVSTREQVMNHTYYSMKYILYLGWSLRELCEYVLSPEKVNSLREFWFYGSYLLQAAAALQRAGYRSTGPIPFYYLMRIDKNFPIKFTPNPEGQVFDTEGQPEIFQLLHFDEKNQILVARSKLYIPPATAKKIFSTVGDVVACEYDPHDKFVKTSEPTEIIEASSPVSLKAMCDDVERLGGKKPEKLERGSRFPVKSKQLVEFYFETKRVSDYFQAADFIKDLCQQLSTPERPVAFQDIGVYVGPWLSVTQGTINMAGGYISEQKMRDAKVEIPYEIIPGVKLRPPAIIIDNELYPSVADRANVLVHEYRHHINQMLGVESPRYDIPPSTQKPNPEDVKKWLFYLNSPDERLAHIEQIKYFLGLGMGREQILRVLTSGRLTYEMLPIAKKYNELINAAIAELKEQRKELQEENRVDTALENLTKDISVDVDLEMPTEYV